MDKARLIAVPSLFTEHGRIDKYVLEGRTLAQHIADLNWDPETLEARVSIDGRIIPQARWQFVSPKAGQSVVIRRVYTGGGGHNGGKNTTQLIAMLAVVALALTAPYAAAALGATI